jgi:hypothetical protein
VSEAVAARRDDLSKGVANRGEIEHLLFDLGQFARGSLLQVVRWVTATARIEELGDFVQGETEALSSFDDAEQPDYIRPVRSMPAGTAFWFGDQAAPFVVTQRLNIHASPPGDLAGTHSSTVRSSHIDRLI